MSEKRPREAEGAAVAPRLYRPPASRSVATSNDPNTSEYQKAAWGRLSKGIIGCVNKVNTGNIEAVVRDLFRLNLERGKGLYCRAVMQAVAVSSGVSPVLAAMTGVVNAYRPFVGELLMKRLIVQFQKAHKRSDKTLFIGTTTSCQ